MLTRKASPSARLNCRPIAYNRLAKSPQLLIKFCCALAINSAGLASAQVPVGEWSVSRRCSESVSATANADTLQPAISADGRHISFVTRSDNLGAYPPPQTFHIYALNRSTGLLSILDTRFATVPSSSACNADSLNPQLSATGRYVAICSYADDLLQSYPTQGPAGPSQPRIYVIDRDRDNDGVFDENQANARQTVLISINSIGLRLPASFRPSISATGRFIAFHSSTAPLLQGDAMGTRNLTSAADVYVHDRDADNNGIFDEATAGARRTIQVNVNSAGQPADTGTNSINASISADGRFVVFESNATNLVADDTNGLSDVFLHDRDVDENGIFDEPGGISTIRVNVSSTGAQSNAPTGRAFISADGQFVAYDSLATTLVAAPTYGVRQVYLFDCLHHTTRLVSSLNGRAGLQTHAYAPSIGSGGRVVVFQSAAALASDDKNAAYDVYAWDRELAASPLARSGHGAIQCVSRAASGGGADFGGTQPAVAADATSVAFTSVSTNLVTRPSPFNARQTYVADRPN